MAFEYGSIDLGIRNPFRLEGAIRAVAGVVAAIFGIIALLSVQGLIEAGARPQGITTAFVGLLLVGWGLATLGGGMFQMFRFFVGRSVPASLARNDEKSQASKGEPETTYTQQQIEQMLQGRQNISFEEPNDWFSRLVHSLFRRLLYLPFAYRNLAQRMARAAAQTLAGLVVYGLAWFSGASGITNVTDTPVMDWLALGLVIYLLFVWYRASPSLSRLLAEDRNPMPGAGRMTLWIGFAIGLPVLLAMVHEHVSALPELPVSMVTQILLVLFFGAGSLAALSFLISARSRTSNPVVEVSEYRDSWQESIHPQEIFIHFENIVMANRRYKEVPNRIYRDFNAALLEQGSSDKGDFSGEMIQETQPIFHTVPTTRGFYVMRVVGSALGASLFVLTAMTFFLLPEEILDATGQLTTSGLLLGFYTLVLGTFGRLLTNLSHAFWAEMQFESLLVYFQCQGTYTESKLSTGTSIYDSTRSENIVVRTSLTPWLIVARAISSTFAASGSLNLERKRHVLELHKAEPEMTEIVGEIRTFLSKREAIANVTNEKDLSSAANMHQINQRTRAQLPNQQTPPLDEARIEDHTGQASSLPDEEK